MWKEVLNTFGSKRVSGKRQTHPNGQGVLDVVALHPSLSNIEYVLDDIVKHRNEKRKEQKKLHISKGSKTVEDVKKSITDGTDLVLGDSEVITSAELESAVMINAGNATALVLRASKELLKMYEEMKNDITQLETAMITLVDDLMLAHEKIDDLRAKLDSLGE